MNTFKKLMLATLILGAGTQAIHANPFSPKAIAAVTLAGLGIGTAGAVKYYGFNTIAIAVLEKCAHAKNWFSNKISDYVFGSYKKQIASMRAAQTQYLEQMADEQAILKQENKAVLVEKEAQLAAKEAQLAAKEADRKDAHERAISLTKQIIAQNKTLLELKTEKERIENTMRSTIQGLNSRSAVHETDKKLALAEVGRLTAIIAEKEQTIAELQETLTQMQAKLAGDSNSSSEERTSESDQAPQDTAE